METKKLSFKEFIKSEGLKKVALTKLKASSYSILIYLFNEILSGADEIICSRKELSLLLGWHEKQTNEGLEELQLYNMIHITEIAGKPLRIRAQLQHENWNTPHIQTADNIKKTPSIGDASNIHSILPQENNSNKNNIKLIDLNIFDDPIPFPKNSSSTGNSLKSSTISNANTSNLSSNENSAKLNDLGAFREKHEIIDHKLKALALEELDTIRHEKRTINSDEEILLQILSQHHEPRKQLILALRSSVIYPNLKFFLANAKIAAEIKDINKKI